MININVPKVWLGWQGASCELGDLESIKNKVK